MLGMMLSPTPHRSSILSLKGGRSPLTSPAELAASCCGNQLRVWHAHTQLSGSDGLWSSHQVAHEGAALLQVTGPADWDGKHGVPNLPPLN